MTNPPYTRFDNSSPMPDVPPITNATFPANSLTNFGSFVATYEYISASIARNRENERLNIAHFVGRHLL